MDRVKLQITNHKLQTNSKFQITNYKAPAGHPIKIPNYKLQITNASPALFGILVIGIWNLFVIWNLWFGIFFLWR
jgi:hypothetical protein